MGEYLLGIDNGGTVTKAALFDLEGNEVAVAARQTEMLIPRPGFTEKDLDEFWKANAGAISEVIRKSGIRPDEIKAVATTGYGNGITLVGHDGKPSYNGIISTDSRAKGYILKWYSDGTFDKVNDMTLSSIWAGQPVSLMAWLRDNMPGVLERTKWVFCIKDYLRYLLTGEAFAEITDYSGISAMNLHTKKIDREVLKCYGLEQYYDLFLPVKGSAEICGYVTRKAAEQTGLKEGTPVAGGLFDIHACCISSGTTDNSKLCLIAGTWSINQYLSEKLVPSKDLSMTSISCIPGYYMISENSPTSASNLDWFVKTLMQRDKEEAKSRNESVYTHIDEVVASINPEESNLVFLPFLFDSNGGPHAKACFMGLDSWHRREHLLTAVFEGVVFSALYHVERLMRFRDKPAVARMAGGPTKSKVWMQMFADALQTPVEVPVGTELGALGAAICAGVASGVFKSFEEAVNSMVRVATAYYPDARRAEAYENKFRLYKKAMELAEVFGQK